MIPFFDACAGYRALQSEIDSAIARVLASGTLILGPEVAAFEREFAAFVGAAHAVGVNSGTDAIIVALRALGIGPGDEVVTVANSGVPPVAAIRAAGALPRFADVLPGSLLIDPESVAGAVSARTRAILVVHLYGQAAALDPLVDIARQRGLLLIEDCAHAHGTHYRGRHVGTFGTIGCFSFYPTKNLGALGDAGLCVSNDPGVAERLRQLRTYGYRNDRHAHCDGLNSRLDEIQAAILRVKLRHLPAAVAARRHLARQYDAGLARTDLRLPRSAHPEEHAYHLYVIQTAARAQVIERLERHAIGFGTHYPTPAHVMEAYRNLGSARGDLPVTERAAQEVLSLPLFPELDAQAVQRVIEVLCDKHTRTTAAPRSHR